MHHWRYMICAKLKFKITVYYVTSEHRFILTIVLTSIKYKKVEMHLTFKIYKEWGSLLIFQHILFLNLSSWNCDLFVFRHCKWQSFETERSYCPTLAMEIMHSTTSNILFVTVKCTTSTILHTTKMISFHSSSCFLAQHAQVTWQLTWYESTLIKMLLFL